MIYRVQVLGRSSCRGPSPCLGHVYASPLFLLMADAAAPPPSPMRYFPVRRRLQFDRKVVHRRTVPPVCRSCNHTYHARQVDGPRFFLRRAGFWLLNSDMYDVAAGYLAVRSLSMHHAASPYSKTPHPRQFPTLSRLPPCSIAQWERPIVGAIVHN